MWPHILAGHDLPKFSPTNALFVTPVDHLKLTKLIDLCFIYISP